MNHALKDNIPNIDPLEALTQEQKMNLRTKVNANLNTWMQSAETAGRPVSSGWVGSEVYRENTSNSLFERMAWEIVNQNFKKNLADKDLQIVSRAFDYFYDFSTPGHDGSNMITRPNMPWLKIARKNLAEYLTNILTIRGIESVATDEYFIKLSDWTLNNDTDFMKEFRKAEPDKDRDYRGWKNYRNSLITKAQISLQRINSTLQSN